VSGHDGLGADGVDIVIPFVAFDGFRGGEEGLAALEEEGVGGEAVVDLDGDFVTDLGEGGEGLLVDVVFDLPGGQEAAEEYRARLAGVSEEAIEQGRLLRQEIAALQETQQEAEPLRRAGQAVLAGQETRLLTRATPRDDIQQQIAQSVKKTNEQGKQQIELSKQQLRAIQGLGRGIPVFSGN
jgi:hypothetical protein